MSEWWTYSLSDLLMFSARTYFRQFELMNRALWPLHLPALGAGIVLIACMLRPRPASPKIAFVLLGLAWLWVGWAYHAQRYADINTGAPYFAAGFGVQGALLLWMATRRAGDGGMSRLAPAIVALALAAYPLLAPLGGRSGWQAEVFGMAPDPTVAVTFAALLGWRAPWPLWVIPLLWSAASAATLMELRAPFAWLLPGLAVLAIVLAARAKLRGEVA
ncbi:DUF6064 family protein [Massilia consociata]|uniref:DUF6064 family protein n=1 Tax=Massilia consociata TaxID=760117 RepID=A0ABV6FKL3_9BURK